MVDIQTDSIKTTASTEDKGVATGNTTGTTATARDDDIAQPSTDEPSPPPQDETESPPQPKEPPFPLAGTQIEKDKDGKPQYQFPFNEKAELDGEYAEFNEKGDTTQKATYAGDVLNGTFTTFDDQKRPWQEFTYVDGQLNGSGKTYSQGVLVMEATYQDGQFHGQLKTYYMNSVQQAVFTYVEGKRQGVQKYFDSTGRPIREEIYENDVLNGAFKSLYPSGAIAELGQYKNGLLDGEHLRFYENGMASEVASYDNGIEQSRKRFDTKGKEMT